MLERLKEKKENNKKIDVKKTRKIGEKPPHSIEHRV